MSRPVQRIVVRMLMLLVVAMGAGCAHTEYVAGFIQAPQGTASTTEPAAQLAMLDGERIMLVGDLAEELKHIPEAQVKAWGYLRGKAPDRRLEVTEYQILDAGEGVTPHVGVLRWDAGRLLLLEGAGRPIVELIGEQAIDLRTQVGAKVWVFGPIKDQEKLEVLRYGVLRPAASP